MHFQLDSMFHKASLPRPPSERPARFDGGSSGAGPEVRGLRRATETSVTLWRRRSDISENGKNMHKDGRLADKESSLKWVKR